MGRLRFPMPAVLVASAILTASLSLTAFAAGVDVPKVNEGTVPSYSNTQLPSISSCDANAIKAGESSATGNAITDTAISTTKTISSAFKNKSDKDEATDGIDGKVTVADADSCGIPQKFPTEKAKDTACGIFKNDSTYIAKQQALVDKSKAALACSRGVLSALNGEIACFQKQLGEADKFIDAMINNPGGLSDILKSGNDQLQKIDAELQDRQNQANTVSERIEGGEKGNPPGLLQAADTLKKLSTSLPDAVQSATTIAKNVQTVEAQAQTAEIMSCMNRSTGTAYKCVTGAVSGNSLYKNYTGTVSVFTHIACIYAQSANKVVGGGVVTNSSAEEARLTSVLAAFNVKEGDVRPSSALNSDQSTYKEAPDYTYNTPDQLLTFLKNGVSNLPAAYQNELVSRYNSCAKSAATKINASKTTVENNLKAKNAGIYRDLRNQYSDALKAATGKSIMINTSLCETGTLDAQTTCFQRLNTMIDCLYTGQSCASGAVSGASIGLTEGQASLKDFLGSVPAKLDPNRTLTVACSGVSDCLTQYTTLRKNLVQTVKDGGVAKDKFKASINTKLQSAAMNLATGRDANAATGAPATSAFGVSLSTVTANISKAKSAIIAAMGKMKVGATLQLDPKKIPEPKKDEATGLYDANSLRNLVLSGINPPMPDGDSAGFGDAVKAIGERDDKLEKQQDDLTTYISDLESAKAKCTGEDSKKTCDGLKTKIELYCNTESSLKTIGDLGKILGNDKAKETGQALPGKCETGAETQCGIACSSWSDACANSVNTNTDKDAQTVDGKKKTKANGSSVAH